tara:strand:+ start:12186 stop:13061 length:876 start_codon:yes stop_codon:yes gene_type:complete
MATQTATTGSLENAQNIIIAQAKYTAEHNMPTANLVEHFTLGKGNKQLTIPKVGQMDAENLVDGIDMITIEEIGLTTTDLTTGEVGLKVVLTYKLVNQFNEDVFRMIGRQMGDAMARKKERDLQALFSALNGGTALGADGNLLNMRAAAGCVVFATANKFPPPVAVVHHPNALGELSINAMAIGSATFYAGILQGYSEELLRNFWSMRVNGVNFFHSGEIDKISGVDSGYGAIFSKSSMCIIEGWAPMVEREKDISMRGHEVVITADYGVFELDDSYGAPMRYEIGAISTT